MPTSTKVSVTPVNTSKIRVPSTTTANSLSPPVVNSLTQLTLPCWFSPVTQSPFVPASTKVSVAPVNTGISSTSTVSSLRSPVMSTLPCWSPPVKSSSFAPASTKVPWVYLSWVYLWWAAFLLGHRLMVSSAMKDISMAQQRLAHDQDLPPIQIAKFVGAPDEFPLFQQRFQHCVMSWKDIDDKKMTRLLQFLGGEAKETVCDLETATGGIHQALQIIQERYGRPCMIISSVVNNLTKGPAITSGDRSWSSKDLVDHWN